MVPIVPYSPSVVIYGRSLNLIFLQPLNCDSMVTNVDDEDSVTSVGLVLSFNILFAIKKYSSYQFQVYFMV
jgi:hypothetical protein